MVVSSLRENALLISRNKKPLIKIIFKIIEWIKSSKVVLDAEILVLTLMVQWGSDVCEDRSRSVCPDLRGRGHLTWKRL